MLTILDDSDIRWYYTDLKSAGYVPAPILYKRTSFIAGGGILFEGALDLPILGDIDFSLKLALKLLSDKKTVRLRIVEVETEDVSLHSLVMLFAERFVKGLVVPGLRWVDDPAGDYIEYRKQQEYIELTDILTQDNRLTIVDPRLRVPLFMQEMARLKQEAALASPSMADKTKAGQKPVSVKGTPGGQATVADHPKAVAPLKGDVTATISF